MQAAETAAEGPVEGQIQHDGNDHADDRVEGRNAGAPGGDDACRFRRHAQHELAVEIADKGELVVPCKEGAVSIKELQVPGKKRMDIKAFLNGLKPLPCPPLKGGSQER